MTRIAERLVENADSISACSQLRAALRDETPKPMRFAVAFVGSGQKGDSGGAAGYFVVLHDDDVDGVDPSRIQILCEIDAETGVASMVRFNHAVWTEHRAAYLEWMRGWYG